MAQIQGPSAYARVGEVVRAMVGPEVPQSKPLSPCPQALALLLPSMSSSHRSGSGAAGHDGRCSSPPGSWGAHASFGQPK